MLNRGDLVGLVVCSDGFSESYKPNIEKFEITLKNLGFKVKFTKYLYKKRGSFSTCGELRAEVLMNYFLDNEIKAIFDISGGDIANEVLNYLDFDIIKKFKKPFFGMSDLTVILNALYKKSDLPTFHYRLKNLIDEDYSNQFLFFIDSILGSGNDLFEISTNYIKGNKMDGIVLGGNIRCLLKLAGTEFMPNFNKKILFLESYSGGPNKIFSLLNQIKQMKIFDEISGLLIGNFFEYSNNNYKPSLKELLLEITENYNFPIAFTNDLGHNHNSKCIIIGREINL